MRTGVAAISTFAKLAAAGTLPIGSVESVANWYRAADRVGEVLRGAEPADLPVEQPTRLGLVVNLNTSRAPGITVPPSFLRRADEVIE